jgi:DNA-directed RNA polymerase specialized sigma24 family protein
MPDAVVSRPDLREPRSWLVRSLVDDPALAEDVVQEALLKALRAAPDLIAAVELGGETPEAAAERLGITRNNLKVRRHRARQQLRVRLEETRRTCARHGCLDCTCKTTTHP